ncbi:MAG: hypothetical protein ACLGIA_12190 [Actinomycetes bacterium]
MSVTAELKKTATDTGYAVVGITDLAVERVREAQARAEAARAEINRVRVDDELKKLQVKVQQLPTVALGAGFEAAGKAEQTFDALATRGKTLVERIREQQSTKEMLQEARKTLSLGKAAVNTVRNQAEETAEAAKETVAAADREATDTVDDVRSTARQSTKGTRAAAKRTAGTARRAAESTKGATKGAVRSAKKTAEVAGKAAEDASEKVGD